MRDGLPTLRKHLRDLRERGDPEIHERVDLRAWTGLGIGGLADLLIRCRSADGVQRVIDLLAAHGRQWLVLGGGSRLVPPDEGLRVPVINLTGQLALWELDLDGAVAGGGANLAQVSHAAARTGISGLERLMAEGGSVGGAANATGRGLGTLAGLLDWVDVVRPGAPLERIVVGRRARPQVELAAATQRRVVVRARLQLSAPIQPTGPPGPARRSFRPARQPRCAAPAFLADGGVSVRELLERSNCGGLAVGGARLSDRDVNVISTTRTSRAEEVRQLVRSVRQRVAERTGCAITTTLCFVDEEGRTVEP